MKKITYFAVFEQDSDGGYKVYFPDLPKCEAGALTYNEALEAAKEALSYFVYEMNKKGVKLPAPTQPDKLEIAEGTEGGYIISEVTVYPELVKNRLDNRAVKTNLTIPAWLKDAAEENSINFSQFLQGALKEYLGLRETGQVYNLSESAILELSEYRRSLSPGADASKPKYQITTPEANIFFKFKLSNNEICAEVVSYRLAVELGIAAAETRVARYKKELGVASFDIGKYQEPDDTVSYSIKDFLHIKGFVKMCLFDYLIMNEDRHGGNWGITGGEVSLLFDHNNCFGGESGFTDTEKSMETLTSALCAESEYQHRHDMIFRFLAEKYPREVEEFMTKVNGLPEISNSALEKLMPEDLVRVKDLLRERISYMNRKVGEFIE